MDRRKLVALLFFFSGATAPMAAQEVYVSNHPFKGAVERSGAATLVELEPFVTALGLELREVDGSLYVLRPGEEPTPCGPGPCGVFLGGQRLESASLEGSPRMVGLEELSGTLNARVVKNKELGTIDVYRPTEAREQASGYGSGYRIVAFGWPKHLSTVQSNLAGFTRAQLVLVDIGDRNSEVFEQYVRYLRAESDRYTYFRLGGEVKEHEKFAKLVPLTILIDPAGHVIERWGLPTMETVTKGFSDYGKYKAESTRKPTTRKTYPPGSFQNKR